MGQLNEKLRWWEIAKKIEHSGTEALAKGSLSENQTRLLFLAMAINIANDQARLDSVNDPVVKKRRILEYDGATEWVSKLVRAAIADGYMNAVNGSLMAECMRFVHKCILCNGYKLDAEKNFGENARKTVETLTNGILTF